MDALNGDSLEHKIKQLPSLPAVVTDIMALIDDVDVDVVALEKKIGQDQSLAARILHIANSPFYGFTGNIGAIKDAVVLLGLHAVRNLVLAASVMKQFPPRSGKQINRVAFWQHSIGTSIASRVIAEQYGLDKDIGFSAGLLHDIGKLALDSYFPVEYTQVLIYREQQECLLVEAENAILGFDHTEVGACIARHWNLPELITTAIEHHHTPGDQCPSPVVDLVHISDIICRGLGIGSGGDDLVPQLQPAAMERLGIEWSALKGLFYEIEQRNSDSNLFLAEITG